MSFAHIAAGLADLRAGRMVILVDDEDRENEGDLCMAAEKVTPQAINFMATHARGLICLTMTEARLAELQVPMMVAENTSCYNTAFTVSVEARQGVTTGISAADRAHTILTALDPATRPEDLVRPGHIFPLRARPGGVLVRAGQTEGSVDLAQLAGLQPAGVICEIMNADGEMARMADLEVFGREHGLRVLSIADLIAYRLAHEPLTRQLCARQVQHPRWGTLRLMVFGTAVDSRQHLAVVKGDIAVGAPLVRVHAGFPFTAVLGDLFAHDRGLFDFALAQIEDAAAGVLVCIDRDTPQLTLAERVAAWGEPCAAPAAAPAEAASGVLRELGIGAQILRALGLSRIRLLSSQPRRLVGLEAYGLHVEEIVAPSHAPPAAAPSAFTIASEGS